MQTLEELADELVDPWLASLAVAGVSGTQLIAHARRLAEAVRSEAIDPDSSVGRTVAQFQQWVAEQRSLGIDKPPTAG